MKIIGREEEAKSLRYLASSHKPEFAAVYGRRRVGKTYLVKELFHDRFAFYATGLLNGKQRDQLKNFRSFLLKHGHPKKSVPTDWFDAFDRLQELLESDAAYRQPGTGKLVVFLDEAPWMDGRRSNFKQALDRFWNAWGSTKEDLLLIVCGSATSWIIKNFVKDEGGFYNRLTEKIHLAPFSLGECARFAADGGLSLTQRQVMELFMVFGGIPYYWSLLRRGESPAQSIERLCFKEGGTLCDEFGLLFKSLFSAKGPHRRIVETMAKRNEGVFRTDLVDSGVTDGESLTEALEELEQCGFLRGYKNATKKERGICYQLIDPFSRFALAFLQEKSIGSWQSYYGTPSYDTWSGNAFELLCLNNIASIKSALGISGVLTNESAWRSEKSKPGAQIDLLIERRDGVINVCEMKYSAVKYSISEEYEENLRNKLAVFRNETRTTAALHLTMIVSNGLVQNEHSDIVVNVITGKDLFR